MGRNMFNTDLLCSACNVHAITTVRLMFSPEVGLMEKYMLTSLQKSDDILSQEQLQKEVLLFVTCCERECHLGWNIYFSHKHVVCSKMLIFLLACPFG